MESLHDLTIKKFHDGLLAKKFSALEITQAYFARIKEKDEEIGAYLSLAEESALREAEAVDVAVAKDEDDRRSRGRSLGDQGQYFDQRTSRRPRHRRYLNITVASYDAGVIKKLKAAACRFSRQNEHG